MFRQESICQFVNRRGWLIAVFLILIGGSIYIVYRPKSIIIFRVIDYFGLTNYVDAIRNNLQEFLILPPIFVNSIPAGLWTTSYLTLMYCNTRFHEKKTRMYLALPLPVSMVVLEFFQLAGLCPGTFDLYDLLCYIVPLIIFIKSL